MDHQSGGSDELGAALTARAVLVVAPRDRSRGIAAALRACGARVDCADSCDEAFGLLGFYAFDAVLADPTIEQGAGAELIRSLTSDGAGRVVMGICDDHDPEARGGAYAAGASATVADGHAACGALDRLLRDADRAAPPAPAAADDADFSRCVDRAVFEELRDAIGPEMIGELLSRVRIDIAEQREAISAAIASDDLPAMRRATHVLISVAGAVGAVPLQRMAEELNRVANDGRTDEARALAGGLLTEADEVLLFVGTQ